MNNTTRAARLVDSMLDRSVALGYGKIGSAVRRQLPTWPCDPQPGALAGQQIVVTGASSGLGEQVAHDVVRLGGHAHLVVRDTARGEAAATRVRQATRGAQCTVWQCDLSDLDSVDDFVLAFSRIHIVVDAIVHNAGAMPQTYTTSAQGHELTLALHVLGPVRMTEGLLPDRPTTDHITRVVFVTSGGMYAQRLRDDDFAYRTSEYKPTVAYARSKRAQVELVPALHGRWANHGARVYAMHPGWARTPGVETSLPGFTKLTAPILRSPADGADTITWLLATHPAPAGGGLWHDRRDRPTNLLASTVTTPQQRCRLKSWVLEQALETKRPALLSA